MAYNQKLAGFASSSSSSAFYDLMGGIELHRCIAAATATSYTTNMLLDTGERASGSNYDAFRHR